MQHHVLASRVWAAGKVFGNQRVTLYSKVLLHIDVHPPAQQHLAIHHADSTRRLVRRGTPLKESAAIGLGGGAYGQIQTDAQHLATPTLNEAWRLHSMIFQVVLVDAGQRIPLWSTQGKTGLPYTVPALCRVREHKHPPHPQLMQPLMHCSSGRCPQLSSS